MVTDPSIPRARQLSSKTWRRPLPPGNSKPNNLIDSRVTDPANFDPDEVLAPPPVAGLRFGPMGRFRLMDKLGSGGAGVVYLVHDSLLDRKVAGKFLHDGGPTAECALRQEACTLARLKHPNIVGVLDYQMAGDAPCLLMDFAEGLTLQDLLPSGPIPVCYALRLASDFARGLHHAHSQGVLHLDLKPSNICLSEGVAKLLDFGVGSEQHLLPDFSRAAAETSIAGTPRYMSPEQWSLAELDERSDIWSFGMVLYEMLTGRLPFGNHPPYLALLRGEGYQSLRDELNLSPSLDALVGRMLQPQPADRLQSSAELVSALRVCRREACREQLAKLPRLGRRLLALLHLVGPRCSEAALLHSAAVQPSELRGALSLLLQLGALRVLDSSPQTIHLLDEVLAEGAFLRLPAALAEKLTCDAHALLQFDAGSKESGT